MIQMRMLSALIILSAAVATPVLAQQAGKRGPGGLDGLDSQSGLRGAYNQSNGPPYAATPTRGHWNPENSGNNERDPSITGGYDTARRPSSS
jgi:hypothetical protein